MFFEDENCRTCFAFYFLALETCLEHPNSGQNNPEIANSELKSQGFLENHVFLLTGQTGTNIC